MSVGLSQSMWVPVAEAALHVVDYLGRTAAVTRRACLLDAIDGRQVFQNISPSTHSKHKIK